MGLRAYFRGIRAFSETDFAEDRKAVDVPTPAIHGDDGQTCRSRLRTHSAKLLESGTLKMETPERPPDDRSVPCPDLPPV